MSQRDVLRALLRDLPVPVVALDDAIDPDRAAGIRAAVAASGLAPFWIADRGRYARNDRHRDEALFAILGLLAGEIAGVALGPPLRAVWTRLTHGDYALSKDDHAATAALPPHLDVTLDLSPAELPGEAQIVYLAAAGQLSMEQRPHRLIIADRRAVPLARWERYLGCRVGAAEVWRLRLAFPPLAPA